MNQEKATIRADFDHIAQYAEDGWDHNQHYHSLLLKQIPYNCSRILEIGCGTGGLAQKLAEHAEYVLALDLSPEMIRIAREHSRDKSNIEFRVADAETVELPDGAFDCIVSVAALHHLPLEDILSRLKTALKPGGILLILDLFKYAAPGDLLTNVLAIPVNWVLALIHRLKAGKQFIRGRQKAIAAAYKAHSLHDDLLPLSIIRTIGGKVLPGAELHRLLLWRYSLVWYKTGVNRG